MRQEQAALDGGRLVELLEHQRVLYRKLRALSDRQRSLVVQEDMKPLLSLLADRQQLVGELIGVSEQLSPFRGDWTTVYTGLDDPSRRHVADMLEEVNCSLSTILQGDSRDTATLSAKRQEVADRMTASGCVRRANAAYAAAGTPVRTGLTDSKA